MIYLNCFSLEILTFLHVETLKVKKLTQIKHFYIYDLCSSRHYTSLTNKQQM